MSESSGAANDFSNKFNKSVRGLFTLLLKIQETREKQLLDISGKTNPITARLKKFIRLYDGADDPSLFAPDFLCVYNKYKTPILAGPDSTTWITENNIKIQSGAGVRGARNDIQIMLSSIFQNSIQIQELAEKQLEGLPDSAWEECKELIYPDVCLLHLYRIFRECCENSSEKNILNKHVESLEKELGLEKEEGPDTMMNGLSGIFSMAGDIARKAGLPVPDKTEMPNEGELEKAVGSIFNNPQAKEMIGNMFKGFQGCDNIGSLFQKVGQSFSDPSMQKMLSSTIGPTVKNALDQNKGETMGVNQGQPASSSASSSASVAASLPISLAPASSTSAPTSSVPTSSVPTSSPSSGGQIEETFDCEPQFI